MEFFQSIPEITTARKELLLTGGARYIITHELMPEYINVPLMSRLQSTGEEFYDSRWLVIWAAMMDVKVTDKLVFDRIASLGTCVSICLELKRHYLDAPIHLLQHDAVLISITEENAIETILMYGST